MPTSPINQDFNAQMADFKDFTSSAFLEMHRLIAECDKAEARCLELLGE